MTTHLQQHLVLAGIFMHATYSSTSPLTPVAGSETPWAREALVSLLSGPCKGTHLLLAVDDESALSVDLARVLRYAVNTLLSIRISQQQSFLFSRTPVHHIRGDLVTAILVFQKDPTVFLQLLNSNREWNPRYFVLICLDARLETTSIFSLPVVQRSEFIFLLQATGKRNKQHNVRAFTSFPLTVSPSRRHLLKASLGVWRQDRFATRETVFAERFKNFGGRVLRLSTWCDDTPFLYYDKNGLCTGQNLDAFDIMAKKYNFSYAVQDKPEDELWSSKKNGTWVGIMGGLEYGQKDIAINAILINWERAHDFDFTYPYQTEGYAFLINLPSPLPNWRRLLHPFSAQAWGAVLASATLVPSLLVVLLRHLNLVHDPVNLAIKVGASLLGQSVGVPELSAWWTRMWVGWWWIAVFILCSVYTGNLVAVLTVPVYPGLIGTVEELTASDLKLVMLDYGDFLPGTLKTSSNSVLASLGAKMELLPYNEENKYDTAIEEVVARTHALLEYYSYLVFVQFHYNMTYSAYIMPEQIYASHLTWFLPRNTPYTRLISRTLTRLKEAGILAYLNAVHLALTVWETTVPRGGDALTLSQLQGPFLLWLIGHAIASLTFSMEFLVKGI